MSIMLGLGLSELCFFLLFRPILCIGICIVFWVSVGGKFFGGGGDGGAADVDALGF